MILSQKQRDKLIEGETQKAPPNDQPTEPTPMEKAALNAATSKRKARSLPRDAGPPLRKEASKDKGPPRREEGTQAAHIDDKLRRP